MKKILLTAIGLTTLLSNCRSMPQESYKANTPKPQQTTDSPTLHSYDKGILKICDENGISYSVVDVNYKKGHSSYDEIYEPPKKCIKFNINPSDLEEITFIIKDSQGSETSKTIKPNKK